MGEFVLKIPGLTPEGSNRSSLQGLAAGDYYRLVLDTSCGVCTTLAALLHRVTTDTPFRVRARHVTSL